LHQSHKATQRLTIPYSVSILVFMEVTSEQAKAQAVKCPQELCFNPCFHGSYIRAIAGLGLIIEDL
ncbi:hypothetical protein MHK_009948, partial [Candidatus Magnetomorum sp. HK-1]